MRELVSIEALGFFDNHTGLEGGLVNLLGHDNRVDTIQTVSESEVGGNLCLGVNPSAILLGVHDCDRTGHDGDFNAEACSATDSRSLGAKEVKITRACDVGTLQEGLNHRGGSGGDIEGESEGTSGDVSGNDVTLLIKNLVGGNIFTLPSSRILNNLSEGRGVHKIGKGLVGVVVNCGEYNEVALSFKQFRIGIQFSNCHNLMMFYLLILLVVVHFKLSEVTEYPED